MTPKEKAKELINKFLTASHGTIEEYVPIPYVFAKQCALIAVEELIMEKDYRKYWEKVKTEIEQL